MDLSDSYSPSYRRHAESRARRFLSYTDVVQSRVLRHPAGRHCRTSLRCSVWACRRLVLADGNSPILAFHLLLWPTVGCHAVQYDGLPLGLAADSYLCAIAARRRHRQDLERVDGAFVDVSVSSSSIYTYGGLLTSFYIMRMAATGKRRKIGARRAKSTLQHMGVVFFTHA